MSDVIAVVQRVALLLLGVLGITDPNIQTSVKAVIAAVVPAAVAVELLIKHLADAHKAAAALSGQAAVATAAAARPVTSGTLQAAIAGQAPAGVPLAGPPPAFMQQIPAPNTAPAEPAAELNTVAAPAPAAVSQ